VSEHALRRDTEFCDVEQCMRGTSEGHGPSTYRQTANVQESGADTLATALALGKRVARYCAGGAVKPQKLAPHGSHGMHAGGVLERANGAAPCGPSLVSSTGDAG